MNWRARRLCVIDTETTGLDPATACVVDLGVAIVEAGVIVDRRGWLVNPGVAIPAECSAIHGITDAMVANESEFGRIAADFVALVEGCIPVAYNSRFDRAVLLAEFLRADLFPPTFLLRGDDAAWIDALCWARAADPYAKGQKLGLVASRLGVEQGEAHRAVGDCVTTAGIIAALASKALHRDSKLPRMPEDFGDLILHQRRLTAERDASYLAWLIESKRTKETAA